MPRPARLSRRPTRHSPEPGSHNPTGQPWQQGEPAVTIGCNGLLCADEAMVPDFVLLYAVVIVLFPLVYFSFASIPFLFVRLDVPEVAQLFRGLFNGYF